MRKFHFEKSRLNQILIDGKLTMKKLDLSVELSFGDLLSSESQCIRKVDIENIRCAKISFANLRVCEGVRIVDSQIDEGVCFTFITAFVFYVALNYWGMETPYFVIEYHFKNFGQVLLGFISIIDVTDWTDTKDLFDLTPMGKVILFFAKLAVSYGIWQTIYAFYKFKRQ